MNQPNNSPNQKMVSKPDADPILALFLTLFVFNAGHVYNGQISAKWPVISLLTVVGMLLCYLPGLAILVLSIIDSYQTAQRLRAGETIGENEYSFSLLYSIAKFVDKTATCSAAQGGDKGDAGDMAAWQSGKCAACGEQNAAGTKFCNNCGTKIGG
jgi:hypothetical protein